MQFKYCIGQGGVVFIFFFRIYQICICDCVLASFDFCSRTTAMIKLCRVCIAIIADICAFCQLRSICDDNFIVVIELIANSIL